MIGSSLALHGSQWSNKILDLLYPPTCITCGEDAAWLCDACTAKIHLTHRIENLDILACGSYADPILRSVLTRFKYHAAHCLREALETIIRRFRDEFLDPWPWANQSHLLITSLPTDPRHIRERGYDHASILADLVKKHLVPWGTRETLLRRTKKSFAHAHLPTNEIRQANIQGAFMSLKSINDPVLLVDDIVTTGASIAEAITVLRAAGAPEVYVLALARGK